MTRFVIAQLAARWGQAVMLLLLSAAAAAAAVSAPVYAGAADRAVIAAELAAADRSELFVEFGPLPREWSPTPRADPAASLLADLDGFAPVVSVQVPVSGLDSDGGSGWLAARQDFCAHVVVHEGRCPVGNREMALSPARADAAGLRPGDEVLLTPVTDVADGAQASGPPAGFTVSGLVAASDPDDPYWGLHHGIVGDALYTTPTSLARLEHRHQAHAVTAVLIGGELTADAVPAVRAELDRVHQEAIRLMEPAGNPPLRSNLPQLLDRIEDSSAQAAALLPVAAVPLVALCWFVVYLAGVHAAAGRRPELGVVAVRGAPARVRTTLAGGELVLPVLVGAPLGFAAGHAAVAAFSGGWVPLSADQLVAALVAIAGSLLAVLLGLWRELSAPAVALLRWVPPRRPRWVLATAEVLALTLTVAAVVQLRAFDAELIGITALAPGLVMLAVAVLAARVAWPVANLVARRAMRRGRLPRAVAAVHLARTPATARLLVVVAVVLGMVGFAAVNADIAGQQRTGHAERVTGAARVLQVEQVDRVRLLEAVRRADPDGRYAMAVVAVAGGRQPPLLAVDSTRLAQVAGWRPEYGEPDPSRTARLLRPSVPASLPVHDGPVTVELSVPDDAPAGSTVLSMTLVSTGGERQVVRFGPLPHGRSVHHAEVSGCPHGCRLAHLGISVSADGPAAMTWHGIEQDGRGLAPQGWGHGQWQEAAGQEDPGRLQVDNGPAGLTVAVDAARRGIFYRVLPPDSLYPLPVVTAGEFAEGSVTNLDSLPLAVAPVARLAGLPRFGAAGVLIDLEYAERSATSPATVGSLEVWLAADAPADIVDRLAAEGLAVTGQRTTDGLRVLLDGSGPAVALRYHLLAAGLAALVALAALAQVAIAQGRTWTASLRRLRVQGVSRRTVTVSVLFSYGGLVAVATVAGVLAAGAGWLATGDRLPLGVEPLAAVWPRWTPVLAPWLAAVAALFAGGAVAAWWQRGVVTKGAVG